MGDACASPTTRLAARSRLGDRGGWGSGCWVSMVRRHSARGGGTSAGRGCGTGGDGYGVVEQGRFAPFVTVCSAVPLPVRSAEPLPQSHRFADIKEALPQLHRLGDIKEPLPTA